MADGCLKSRCQIHLPGIQARVFGDDPRHMAGAPRDKELHDLGSRLFAGWNADDVSRIDRFEMSELGDEFRPPLWVRHETQIAFPFLWNNECLDQRLLVIHARNATTQAGVATNATLGGVGGCSQAQPLTKNAHRWRIFHGDRKNLQRKGLQPPEASLRLLSGLPQFDSPQGRQHVSRLRISMR